MALILKGAVRLYYYLNEDIADSRSKDWFLMSTPWPGLCLLVLYLMIVLKWLPAHMKSRPAYDLRPIIILYDITQIVFCFYIVYQAFVLAWFSHYKLFCQPTDEGPHSIEIAWRVAYGYFVMKFIDLIDTMFFVLRKKQSHVTFLHVYHHFGMVMVAWGIVKWVPGGHILFMVTMNTAVHVVMYSYYLLTTWDESYKESLWWKKHVTQIQLAQFSLILCHFIVLLAAKDCGFPRQPALILIPQTLYMVILFGDFYYRTYIKAGNKKV